MPLWKETFPVKERTLATLVDNPLDIDQVALPMISFGARDAGARTGGLAVSP